MKKMIKYLSLFVFILILLNYAVLYLYETPHRQAVNSGTHQKLMKWNEINNTNNKFDAIILGSSRGYCAYNPKIIDSILDINTLNMCTGSQNIVESYYMLMEIFKLQKPKVVIYEMFLPSFKTQPDYYHVFWNAEFMSIGSKSKMILNGFGVQGFKNAVFPLIRYKPYINRGHSDISLFQSKNNKTNTTTPSVKTPWVKGYFYDKNIVDSATVADFPPIYSFTNVTLSIDRIEKGLIALNELCKENNAELICVRAPYPPSRIEKSPLDAAHYHFKKVCKKNKILFFDFNYQANTIIYEDFCFSDYHHMNTFGANKVTEQLSKTIKQTKFEIKKK